MNLPFVPRVTTHATDVIQTLTEIYCEHLPPPEAVWPADVRAVFVCVHKRLFEIGLEVQRLRTECGTLDHNISARFAFYVGTTIKTYILAHRIQLAKELLAYDHLKITQIAFAVGYANPSAFTATFRSYVGCSPSEFREKCRKY